MLDLAQLKDLIRIKTDAYDELLQSALEWTSDEPTDKLHFLATMCHLEMTAPEIGAIVKSYSLDDFSEDYKVDGTETWCQRYNTAKIIAKTDDETSTDVLFPCACGAREGINNDFTSL